MKENRPKIYLPHSLPKEYIGLMGMYEMEAALFVMIDKYKSLKCSPETDRNFWYPYPIKNCLFNDDDFNNSGRDAIVGFWCLVGGGWLEDECGEAIFTGCKRMKDSLIKRLIERGIIEENEC